MRHCHANRKRTNGQRKRYYVCKNRRFAQDALEADISYTYMLLFAPRHALFLQNKQHINTDIETRSAELVIYLGFDCYRITLHSAQLSP